MCNINLALLNQFGECNILQVNYIVRIHTSLQIYFLTTQLAFRSHKGKGRSNVIALDYIRIISGACEDW